MHLIFNFVIVSRQTGWNTKQNGASNEGVHVIRLKRRPENESGAYVRNNFFVVQTLLSSYIFPTSIFPSHSPCARRYMLTLEWYASVSHIMPFNLHSPKFTCPPTWHID